MGCDWPDCGCEGYGDDPCPVGESAEDFQIRELSAELSRLRSDLARVTKERDEARAIVEKLPKTGDGVGLIPLVDTCWVNDTDNGPPAEWLWNSATIGAKNAYSTREAAENARRPTP